MISYASFCQTSKINFQIDTIQDYRIKIDGGCGIYNFKELNSDASTNRNCFVISQYKIGFFAIKDHFDQVFGKRVKIKHLKDGTIRETFTGEGFTCVLTTSNLLNTANLNRQGILEISNSKMKTTIEVMGMVEYKL